MFSLHIGENQGGAVQGKFLLYPLSIGFALILIWFNICCVIGEFSHNYKIFDFFFGKQTPSSINLIPSNISMGVMLLATHMNSELLSLILDVHLYWVTSCINAETESWQIS